MVKAIFTSDFHLNKKLIEETIKIAEKEEVDVFINTGDFLSNDFANTLAKRIFDLGIKGYFVEGNWDSGLVIDAENVTLLKHSYEKYKNYYFFGTYEKVFLTYHDFLDITKEINNKKLVFLTHEPPRGILDEIWNGKHVGNEDYSKFDEIKKPLIHAFGHIHERNGFVKKETLYINSAMADIHKCYVVNLKTLEIKEFKI